MEVENSEVESNYVHGPKKKRKSYIIFALGEDIPNKLMLDVQNFLKSTYAHFSQVAPKEPKDLLRLFNRQIVILLISDGFSTIEENVLLIKNLKLKKQHERLPIIFLTNQSNNLIKAYNESSIHYNESDQYLEADQLSPQVLIEYIDGALNSGKKKRSRRYKINLTVELDHLTKGFHCDGRILDLSMHGALISLSKSNIILRKDDQLRIKFHTQGFVGAEEGNYLRLAGKVKRVQLNGNQAAISWEYVTEKQTLHLTKFLTTYVHEYNLLNEKPATPTS